MDYHPKEILVTAAYLACKAEEFNVTMEQFVANINGNKERATGMIFYETFFSKNFVHI